MAVAQVSSGRHSTFIKMELKSLQVTHPTFVSPVPIPLYYFALSLIHILVYLPGSYRYLREEPPSLLIHADFQEPRK